MVTLSFDNKINNKIKFRTPHQVLHQVPTRPCIRHDVSSRVGVFFVYMRCDFNNIRFPDRFWPARRPSSPAPAPAQPRVQRMRWTKYAVVSQ